MVVIIINVYYTKSCNWKNPIKCVEIIAKDIFKRLGDNRIFYL